MYATNLCSWCGSMTSACTCRRYTIKAVRWPADLLKEAADTIAAQAARIEALEEALRDAEAQLACVRPQKSAVACALRTISQALEGASR